MIINQTLLFEKAPIKNMLSTKEREHGVSYGLTEGGYDIRIKQDITFTPHRDHPAGCYFSRITKADAGNLTETGKHGRFALASAIEEFDMPEDLVGVVHDKSSWARKGLSVFNTVIEPGWKGFLTLELVYHGQAILHIPAGSGIAQVLFHKIDAPAHYEGKYQHQADHPVEAIFKD